MFSSRMKAWWPKVGLLDEGERALLDDGTRAHSLSDELDDEEPDAGGQLGEAEGADAGEGGRVVEVVELLVGAEEAVEVDVGAEGRHVFAVVVLGVDLKHLHVQLLDVLHL